MRTCDDFFSNTKARFLLLYFLKEKKRVFVLLKEFQTHLLATEVTDWSHVNFKNNVP